jgi:integrase
MPFLTRHGLRAAEVCDLRWDQVEFDAAVLHVRRYATIRVPLGDKKS